MSGNNFDLSITGSGTALYSQDNPTLLCGDNPTVLCGDNPTLLCGDNPTVLCGNISTNFILDKFKYYDEMIEKLLLEIAELKKLKD